MSENENLDERGLEAAYETLGMPDHPDQRRPIEPAIRAYLQTAAADVSGMVERLHHRKLARIAANSRHAKADGSLDDEAASTLQTLSARNAALEAENERLRGDRDKWKASAEGWQKIAAPKADAFGTRELLHDAMDRFARTEAALSAPKGGQDHG